VSVVGEQQRALIEARAARRCEYCHLPVDGQVARFPIDHIIPRNAGGRTEMDNLALICPHCDGRKWAHTEGIDPISREAVRLFNPRTQAWSDHFQWSKLETAIIEGKTPCRRATIARLQMNHPDMIAVRKLLVALGILAVVNDAA
jgi:hypothetical protein